MTAGDDRPEQDLDWESEIRRGGSLKLVDLDGGTRGWASPPGNFFQVRGPDYFVRKSKVASCPEWFFKPLGVDWLKSGSKIDNALARHDNRVARALSAANCSNSFVFAVNLQVPSREHHSAIFYYTIEQSAIVHGTLLHRFIHDSDDSFRNSRFKLINRIIKGPWIVKAAVGNHSACLLGKALSCKYYRAPNSFEIDVDIGSSTVATYILHLALGYVSSVAIDMGFLVEAQSEDELPEKLMGAIRISQIDMESAVAVESIVQSSSGGSGGANSSSGGGSSGGKLQSSISWKKLGRGLSMLGRKVDDEHKI